MDYQLVTTNEQLAQACDIAHGQLIALDTEFVRTKTYFPELGLIQLYVKGDTVKLIDPLLITDWTPFTQLLARKDLLKIFHACSEDLEVFQKQFGFLPEPLLDTQIAAAFVGHPTSMGFAAMVAEYLGVTLDKTESRTNWLARPLTEKQCHYASADVYYLMPLAEKIIEKVQQANRMSIVEQECDMLKEKRSRIVDPAKAYLSITHAWQLDRKALGYLQRLAAWRLNYAIEHNTSLNFVLHESILWKLAHHQPQTLQYLNELGMRRAEVRVLGETLLEMLKAPLLEADYPERVIRVIDLPNYKTLVKKIKLLVARAADNTGLPTALLASTRQINQYILWHFHPTSRQPDLIQGWRQTLFEEDLNAIFKK